MANSTGLVAMGPDPAGVALSRRPKRVLRFRRLHGRPPLAAVGNRRLSPVATDVFQTPVVGRQLLRCDRCQRSEEVTHAALMRYLLKGWPGCCGEVMGYFVEARRPSLTDDTGDRP